jgi:hypothetical protein
MYVFYNNCQRMDGGLPSDHPNAETRKDRFACFSHAYRNLLFGKSGQISNGFRATIEYRAHPILNTLARSTAVNTLIGMLAENEHLAYVVNRAGDHKCGGGRRQVII